MPAPPRSAHPGPSLVVVVRHAEKDTATAGDPGLSPAGQRRAQALARAFAEARLEAIITTPYRRTRETARPLAKRLEMETEVVPVRGGLDAHVAELVAAVRRHAGPVLVVGHTNTIPAIVHALGGPRLPPIPESRYGVALVLTPRGHGVSLLQLRYGEADPVTGDGADNDDDEGA